MKRATKIVLFVGGSILAMLVVIGIVTSGGSTTTVSSAGETDGKLVIDTTPLSTKSDGFSSIKYLCTTVNYTNNTSRDQRFNALFDWKMKNADGAVSNASVNGFDDSLSAGELVPGGKVSGSVCFTSKGSKLTPGEYTVMNERTEQAWVTRL